MELIIVQMDRLMGMIVAKLHNIVIILISVLITIH